MKKKVKFFATATASTLPADTEWTEREDAIAEEMPLEIHLQYGKGDQRRTLALAVAMRTPGHDEDLVAGFLLTEGIIATVESIMQLRFTAENQLLVSLHPAVIFEEQRLSRHVFAASSCGICGKAALEAIHTITCYFAQHGYPTLTPSLLYALPEKLRAAQTQFEATGSVHAAGLFDSAGQLLLLREDVGRHNAVDKVLGAALRSGMEFPLRNSIMMVSGRAAFELVQKTAMAGIPLLAAVGAPTDLAVEMAESSGMTLVGFLSSARFNVYTDFGRIGGTGMN